MDRHVSSKQRFSAFRKAPLPEGGQSPDAQKNGQPQPRAKVEDRRRYRKDYLRWLRPYRFSLAFVFLLALMVAALDAVWPLAIRGIGNLLTADMTTDAKVHSLNVFGAAIVAILLFKQIVDSLRDYRIAVLNAKVLFRLRGSLFDKLLSLPLSELGEMKSGGIASRLSGDVDNVSGLVQQAIISPGVAAIRLIIMAGFLLWMTWRLALPAAAMLTPLAIVSFLWFRRVRPIYRSIREDRTAIDARATETFGGIRVVRSFRREAHERHDYALGHHTVIRKSLWASILEMVLDIGWGLLLPGTIVMIVWFGGWLFLHGKAAVGDIMAIQLYAILTIQPVWQIISSFSQTQRSMASMERIFAVLEMPPDKPDLPDSIAAPRKVEQFTFENVTFEYRPGVTVIRDFNLNVAGGQTVALVGPSGAGKTTLTDLVARFQDPTHGVIRLNGIDLKKLKLKSYRSLLAVVQQEVFLFDGTVRENIAYGRRHMTEAQVIDAAERANAHEFIARLPDGYNTIIGERGFKLSGGQRQRLSIARAILADPQILILDEATSNLDTESEQLIQASMADLLRGRTTFVIAHRLSTITHADLIVAIDQGRIIETGSHEQLMRNGGLYYEMVQRQQKAFGVLPDDLFASPPKSGFPA